MPTRMWRQGCVTATHVPSAEELYDLQLCSDKLFVLLEVSFIATLAVFVQKKNVTEADMNRSCMTCNPAANVSIMHQITFGLCAARG